MERAETDDGMAGGGISNVGRIKRRALLDGLADGHERRQVRRLQLRLATKSPQGIPLPSGDVRRPFEDVGKSRGFVGEISVFCVHISAPIFICRFRLLLCPAA
ncbi:hypothetical protein [Aurantimonas aggregata]|uniref:hypothetical protein n=1 Tax=Aurantimonas aggregata TaxID=2047720 RepID=UPI001FE3EB17|nr:hypothetical protein [Aurantimonas aggregata]